MAKRGAFDFRLVGLEALDKALAELPKAVAKQTLDRILRKGARPVVKQAKANLSGSGDGKLAKSIRAGTSLSRYQRRRRRKAGDVELFIGPTLPHGHLKEWGTGPRYHKKSGKYVGSMPAEPYMRPAWDATKHKVLAIISEEAWNEIAKAAKKLAERAEAGKLGKSVKRDLARR